MILKNESGLKPLGAAVLCIPYEPEFAESLIFIPPTAQERSRMVETRVIVLEVGPECWLDEAKPRAKVGDKVLVGAMAGRVVNGPKDGNKYRVVNAGDIFLQITEEAKS